MIIMATMIYIDRILTRKEIMTYINNLDIPRIVRFISGYKLTDLEITTIAKEHPYDSIIDAIKFYQYNDKKAYVKNNLSLPIFMCYGAKDIQSGRENTQVLINILKDIGYTNITGLEYPNLFHKILFEGYHNFIYRDIINFLLK